MPPYPGLRHSMEVKERKDSEEDDADDDWAAQYQAYLEEKELETEDTSDQKDAEKNSGNDVVLEEEDWAIQYAKHCEEQEREFFGSNKIKEV